MLKKNLLAFGLILMVCFTAAGQSGSKSSGSNATATFLEGLQFALPGSHFLLKKSSEKKDSSTVSTSQSMRNGLKQGLDLALESFMPFQFKYAILLNESVEKLSNAILYKTIDSWYGTRYRYGGTSLRGIDCSAFMQVLGNYAFGWILPRTAREQYASMTKIMRDELQEGDFVFFNTTGGVSHVGMYLANNKFVHSSSSQGVSIGDLDDKYWRARFLGARRSTQPRPEGSSLKLPEMD